MTDPGLCTTCRHARTSGNRRGSVFWLCSYSQEDPRYPKYPALPVFRCAAFDPAPAGGPDEDEKVTRTD